MNWIANTKKKKPNIDERYESHKYSVTVLIHLKVGLNFIGYWDYEENIWYADMMPIEDEKVMFWCNIPKLPKILSKE